MEFAGFEKKEQYEATLAAIGLVCGRAIVARPSVLLWTSRCDSRSRTRLKLGGSLIERGEKFGRKWLLLGSLQGYGRRRV